MKLFKVFPCETYGANLPDFKRAGTSRLLKEKGREQFWPKKGNLHRTRKNLKNGQNFTPFWVNKMFYLKFNTFKTLQVAP
jgi:hypothetical protein